MTSFVHLASRFPPWKSFESYLRKTYCLSRPTCYSVSSCSDYSLWNSDHFWCGCYLPYQRSRHYQAYRLGYRSDVHRLKIRRENSLDSTYWSEFYFSHADPDTYPHYHHRRYTLLDQGDWWRSSGSIPFYGGNTGIQRSRIRSWWSESYRKRTWNFLFVDHYLELYAQSTARRNFRLSIPK